MAFRYIVIPPPYSLLSFNHLILILPLCAYLFSLKKYIKELRQRPQGVKLNKVGDLALKKLASLLKARLRSNDFIARFGGEEFAIILPHTDLEGATMAGNGLREFIDNAAFSYQGKQIPLTISIGVSEFKKDDDQSSIFERADKALYLAKNSGRNTVKTEIDVINNEMASINADAIPDSA